MAYVRVPRISIEITRSGDTQYCIFDDCKLGQLSLQEDTFPRPHPKEIWGYAYCSQLPMLSIKCLQNYSFCYHVNTSDFLNYTHAAIVCKIDKRKCNYEINDFPRLCAKVILRVILRYRYLTMYRVRGHPFVTSRRGDGERGC